MRILDMSTALNQFRTGACGEIDDAMASAREYTLLNTFRAHVVNEQWMYLKKWNPPIDATSWLPLMFPENDTRGCFLLISTIKKFTDPGRFVAEIQSTHSRKLDDLCKDEFFDPAYSFIEKKLNSFGEVGFYLITDQPRLARDEFYESREWKELRYRALEYYGGRCMVCGRMAKHGSVIHVDHIKPRSRFPELQLEFSNLQVLCGDCNLGKGNQYVTDWRW